MFTNEHTKNPQARQFRRMKKAVERSHGAADRIAAAEANRERKAEKRVRDAHRTELGQMVAAERMADGLPR